MIMSQIHRNDLSRQGSPAASRESPSVAPGAVKRIGAGKFALLFWGLPFVLLIVLLATRGSCA
jgi:hypothetical protein